MEKHIYGHGASIHETLDSGLADHSCSMPKGQKNMYLSNCLLSLGDKTSEVAREFEVLHEF